MSANELVCSSLDNKTAGSFASDLLTRNGNATATKCPPKDDAGAEGAGPGVKMRSVSVPCEKWPCADSFDQEDNEEYPVDAMTGSYGEICFDQNEAEEDHNESKEDEHTKDTADGATETCQEDTPKDKKRPNSLILQKSSLSVGVQTSGGDQPSDPVPSFPTTDSQTTSIEGSPPSLSSEELLLSSYGHRRTGSDTSGLMELQGMVAFEGDMVTFVADDLQEKIKMSSPVSKPGSRSSTPSLYRYALQPQVPLVDAAAISELESQARKVATCLDTLLGNLSGTLHSISSLTVDCIDTQEKAVCKTCDAVDANIKSMYQLMAKCEELSNAMQPIYKIAEDIKEIKRLLDLFEKTVDHRS